MVTTSRGTKLFVQFYTPYIDVITLRAIHRIKGKWLGYSYQLNGQGSRNLSTLLFNGETGNIRWATVEEYRQSIRCNMTHLSDDEFEKYFVMRTAGPSTNL
ncbi:hypothetical protein [Vibrio sp. YIC-376]|uniref:hypothetical protein n=1 Tax=Vibrio sp. YIC-376 TaxID=3136162 RepID=UPI00402B0130